MPGLLRVDNGICLYSDCHRDVPDGINIELCPKHLERAFAAYLITNDEARERLNL